MEQDGFLKKRKFTDIICAIIFLAYIVFMFYMAIYGWSKGDLGKIAQPIDSSKNKCGQGDYEDFKYLYINNPSDKNFSEQTVCVTKCPKEEDDAVSCKPNKQITNCNDIKVHSTYGFLERICLPTAKKYFDNIKGNINLDYATEAIEEIAIAWPNYIIAFLLTVFIACVFYLLMRCFAFVIVWCLVLGTLVGLIVGGVVCFKKYQSLNDQGNDDSANEYKTGAILLWIASGIYLLLMLCLCSQINLALKLIKASCTFIATTPTIIFVPLIHTVIAVLWTVFWLYGFLYIYSVGETTTEDQKLFQKIIWEDKVKAFVGLFILGGLWLISFTISTNVFTIAAMAATWYFSAADDGIGMLRGMCWAYSYHLGSLAFGSFIIALIWFIQIILSYIYSKLKDKSTSIQFLMKCIMCFVACFERLMKFVNKHAYIEVLLRNKTFCGGVFKAVSLLTGNFLRVGILMGLVSLVMFIKTIFIVSLVGFICFYSIQGIADRTNDQIDTVGPLIICVIIATFTTVLFNYIFSVSSDTMLHCYIYEEENPGMMSGKMPDELRQAINNVKQPNKMNEI